MFERRVSEMIVIVTGLLAEAAFYADFDRDRIPVWLRVAAHTAVAMPLLFPGPVVPRPPGQGSRAWPLVVALASAVYLGLAVGSLALVARGVRMHGLAFYLAAESAGAGVASISLGQAMRCLIGPRRAPPEPLYQAPWAGAYRTRPVVPPEPPPLPAEAAPTRAPAPPPYREVGYALLSTMFAGTGALMAWHPGEANDRFLGLTNMLFFGLSAWLFWEQSADPDRAAHILSPTAQRRAVPLTGVAGLASMALALGSSDVSPAARVLVGAVGAVFAVATARGVLQAVRGQTVPERTPALDRRRAGHSQARAGRSRA